MAEVIVMPKAGNSVESCIILEWSKQEGDAVTKGEILCEAETDKATIGVESTAEGYLLKQLYHVDDEVAVMSPLAIVGQKDEDISQFLAEIAGDGAGPASAHTAAAEKTEETEKKGEEASIDGNMPSHSVSARTNQGAHYASPRAKNRAAAKGVDISKISGSGPQGRIIERDILAACEGGQPLSPAALEKWNRMGYRAPAWGSGIGGRILQSDLVPPSPEQGEAGDFDRDYEDIKVRGVRKMVAARMQASLQKSAQVSMHISADAARILALRKRFKESPDAVPFRNVTINDLVMMAVVYTLREFPELNAHWLGEKIRRFHHIHIGCAVDTPQGLFVPVIPCAETLDLLQMAAAAKEAIRGCIEGTIGPDELSGSTFTITNVGMLGIEHFTPVLNSPEVGIVGVCAIQPKPVMKDGEVRFIPHIGLSLTFDHQAVDGAPAGRFLQALAAALENIDAVVGDCEGLGTHD